MTAISPAMTSLTVIIALLFTKGDKAGLILAWTTLAGATLQVLLQLPPYFQAGFKYRFDMDIKNERVKKIGEIIFPALLSCTIGQINIYIDMLFAFRLTEGSWTAIGYANRFFQFPVGVVITPMLVSIFPTFSKFVGEKNWEELRVYFQRSINSLWFVSFPIFVTLAMFSMEGTKIVLQRGKFDAHDTFMVTEALFYLSFAILFYVVRDTLTRIYYAFDDAKTPFLTALIAVGLKALLNALLVGPFGIGGITLSTGIMSGINGLLLAYFVRKKISLEFLKLLHSLKKLVMSSLIMAGVLFCSKTLFYHYLGDGRIALILNISISLALGCTAYFISAIFLKIEAAELIFDKTRIKIKSYYRRDNIEEKI
jgi:putative peptidoglycan lipid II flippase